MLVLKVLALHVMALVHKAVHSEYKYATHYFCIDQNSAINHKRSCN